MATRGDASPDKAKAKLSKTNPPFPAADVPAQPAKKKSFLRRLSLSASSSSKAKAAAAAAPLSASAGGAGGKYGPPSVPPIAARYTQPGAGAAGSGVNGAGGAYVYGRSYAANGQNGGVIPNGAVAGHGTALSSVPEIPQSQFVPPQHSGQGRYDMHGRGPTPQVNGLPNGAAPGLGSGAGPLQNGRMPPNGDGAYVNGYPTPSGPAHPQSTHIPNGRGVAPAVRKAGSAPPIPSMSPNRAGPGIGAGAVPTAELDRLAIRQALIPGPPGPKTPPASPPRHRGPIHPALASPPNSPPKQTNATPYDMQVLGRDAVAARPQSLGAQTAGQSMRRGESGQSLAAVASGQTQTQAHEQGQGRNGPFQQQQQRQPRNPIQPALAAPPAAGAGRPNLGIQIPSSSVAPAGAAPSPGQMSRGNSQTSPSQGGPPRSPPRLAPRAGAVHTGREPGGSSPQYASPMRSSPLSPIGSGTNAARQSPRSPVSPSSPGARQRQVSGPIPGAAAAQYPGQRQTQSQGQTQMRSPASPTNRAAVPTKAPVPGPVPAGSGLPPPAIMRQTSSSYASIGSGGPTSPTYINSPIRVMDESPFHPNSLNTIASAPTVMRNGASTSTSGTAPAAGQGGQGLAPVSAPTMNARSLSNSITPVRRPSTDFKPPPPPAPPASAPPVRPKVEVPDTANPAMSEATRYALAIAGPKQTSPQQRRASRPLPQVPGSSGPAAAAALADGAAAVSGSEGAGAGSLMASFPSFNFTKSPTLPDLVDPRRLALLQQRPRPARLTFSYIISIGRIQRNLLPYLGINSFLALLGTSDRVRKAFTGEMVGKWVLREWGVKLEGSKGKSWPNLTVWEGFLESQLHDPSTYATYPAQWHKLLQHLCLSYSLIVLYLRSLPASSFPQVEEEDDRPMSRAEVPIRNDRLVEIVMPSPLSGGSGSSHGHGTTLGGGAGHVRSGSMSAGSSPLKLKSSPPSISTSTFPRRRGTTGPPISYPAPKRYNFSSGGSIRTRRSSDSRPGSVFSYQSTPSIAPSVPRHRLIRDSVASDPGQLALLNQRRMGSPAPKRIEPVFDKPPPFLVGKAAVLRVFVPLSDKVPRWPSAEGAYWTVKEMEKCGAMRKLKLGDLVANTAIKQPRATEHILVYVPGIKHLFVPLEYLKSASGHLPSYIDSLSLPPSYHYPLLSPIIIFPDLARFAPQAMASIRLAYDHKDVVVSTGRASAKRCIHVTGFEVPSEEYEKGVAREWGIITLEAEGTGEGKAELERRLGHGDPAKVGREAWEVVREKSIGTVWLRPA